MDSYKTKYETKNETGFDSKQEYDELLKLIETLPAEYRGSFEDALENLTVNQERRCRILGFIQESLSQLRLDMKYLMFDLDATRRERDSYKKELESRL